MSNYELMYIVKPDLQEEATKAITERLQGVVADSGAELTNLKEMGKRRLAYEINDYREGFYVLMNFQGNAALVSELDRLLRINEDVMRHIIVKEEE